MKIFAFEILISGWICLKCCISQNFQDCLTNIYEQENNFYLLSDYQANSNSAQSICMVNGGKLPQITVKTLQNPLKQIAIRKYIPEDLISVEIYERSDEPYKDNFKFRPSSPDTARDDENLMNYDTPDTGRIKTFRLYQVNSSRNGFNDPVRFCYYTFRDAIRRECDNGWNENFIFYGGTDQTNQTITLYNYINNQTSQESTNLYFNNSVQTTVSYLLPQFAWNVFIPDISVFFGARSKMNQSDWFWSNRTKVFNSSFPKSNITVCQQMTWPLTYDDGINLRLKHCEDEAYFICQIRFEFQVRPVMCNGSALRITWNQQSIQQITNEIQNLTIQFKVNGSQTKSVSFIDNEYVFAGLMQRTLYKIQATIEDCDQINISASQTATTFFGIPDPVMNARVVNDTNNPSDCIIEWEHEYEGITYLSYRIRMIQFPETPSRLELVTKRLRERIDLSHFQNNGTIAFQVQTFTCQGSSPFANVTGTCLKVEEEPSSSMFNVVLIVAVSAGAFVFILLLIVGFLCCKRNASTKHSLSPRNRPHMKTQKDTKPSTKNKFDPAEAQQANTDHLYTTAEMNGSEWGSQKVKYATAEVNGAAQRSSSTQEIEDAELYCIPSPILKTSPGINEDFYETVD